MTTREHRLRGCCVAAPRRLVVLLTVALLAAGVLTGCGNPLSAGSPEVDPGQPVTSAPASQGADDPGDDGDTDGGGDDGAPSLHLPQLPIGGDAEVVSGTDLQCVDVSWIVDQDRPGALVPGYAISVDTIVVPAPFAPADSGCSDGPPSCVGHTFTADSGAQSCQAAVILVRPFHGVEQGVAPVLTIEGTVVCGTAEEPVTEADCSAFRDGVASSPQHTIQLSTDFTPDPSASPSESTGSTTGG